MHLFKYNADQHGWPASRSWKPQLKPYFDQDGFYSFDDLVTDGWGMPIEYEFRTGGGRQLIRLRSFGQNLLDDKGGHDDVVVEIDANEVK